MTIEINLNAELKDRAKDIAESRMNYGFRDVPNQTDYKYNSILTAVLGELALEQYLTSEGIVYERVSGKNDNDDFNRYFQIGDLKIETKTSPYVTDYSQLSLLYNIEEYDTKKSSDIDYVIQVYIEQSFKSHVVNLDDCNHAQIAGAVDFSIIPDISNIFRSGQRGQAYRIRQNQLTRLGMIFQTEN